MARLASLPLAESGILKEHLRHNLWNSKYLDRNIKKIFQIGGIPSSLCLAYFDNEGILLALYGSETAKKELLTAGIRPGTIWNAAGIGHNAVTDGLTQKKVCSSNGDENELSVLKKFSLYYCPALLKLPSRDGIWNSLPSEFGGLAAIVPSDHADADYQLLTASLTHGLVMTLHFNQHATRLYEQMGSGILIIDSSMDKNGATITYISPPLLQSLGIPSENLLFRPLEEFLPQKNNSAFWKLATQLERVSDAALTLTIEGRAIYCKVSCIPFDQPFLDASGVICFITTPQMESREISRRMGNSAILSFPNIIGQSEVMRSAIRRAALIAGTDSNVMILGESGVGKDVFAQAIHNSSHRKDKPFIVVNCGALPRDLIASELFGYDGGAFTGAKRTGNIGKFELANGGTIFLDEIGDLPLDLQATLLRVVEQKQLMRLGSNRLIDIDVKIISATNANLPQMIKQKLFRSDLLFRLSTLSLSLPPLRERGDDVVLLANHFIHTICERIHLPEPMILSAEAADLLMTFSWPGNVRELQNLVESIVQLYPEHVIEPRHILENIGLSAAYLEPFPALYQAGTPVSPKSAPVNPPDGDAFPMNGTGSCYAPPRPHRRKQFTKEDILAALTACGGNRSQAAEYLDVSRKTLYRKMEQFGITSDS